MPHIDRNARAALLAIWRAGAKEHRDVDGAEFLVALERAGDALEERKI